MKNPRLQHRPLAFVRLFVPTSHRLTSGYVRNCHPQASELASQAYHEETFRAHRPLSAISFNGLTAPLLERPFVEATYAEAILTHPRERDTAMAKALDADHRTNWLLTSLECENFAALEPYLDLVGLERSQVIYKLGDPIRGAHVAHAAVVSLVKIMQAGNGWAVTQAYCERLPDLSFMYATGYAEQMQAVSLEGYHREASQDGSGDRRSTNIGGLKRSPYGTGREPPGLTAIARKRRSTNAPLLLSFP